MLLLFLLFNSLTANYFLLAGVNSRFEPIWIDSPNCNYQTNCSTLICTLLQNTSLGLSAIILLPVPSENKIPCPPINNDYKVNMISFMFLDSNNDMLTDPVACNTMSECMNLSCNNYNSNPDRFGMGFFGICLS